jgi:pimeloyl-ACP methyl ester carboxylesterase
MPFFRALLICAAALLVAISSASAREVSFATPDGGVIQADLYGETGRHGIVLAHGYGSDRSEWATQAEQLAAEGYVVLAIDFRGTGESKGGPMSRSLYLGGRFFDVLGGIQYLRDNSEADRISVIGARLGASIVAYAVTKLEHPELLDSVILVEPTPFRDPQMIPGRKLMLLSTEIPLFEKVRTQFDELPSSKKLVVVGSAGDDPILATILAWLADVEPNG